jgi:hypothetical protein
MQGARLVGQHLLLAHDQGTDPWAELATGFLNDWNQAYHLIYLVPTGTAAALLADSTYHLHIFGIREQTSVTMKQRLHWVQPLRLSVCQASLAALKGARPTSVALLWAQNVDVK